MKRVIREGDRSREVADVQARLRALGRAVEDPTGSFGSSTTGAVRSFQQERSLLVDGLVGPQTWAALVEASWRLGDRTLYLRRPFMRGDDVGELQKRLNALGFDAGKEDGIFGPLAYHAVRGFQREYGVPEDGMFGPKSYASLAGLRVDRPGTSAHLREELRHSGSGVQDLLVVIDPGHGGEDAGDIGPMGLAEAGICWDIGTTLAERLIAAGARVRFTRTEPDDPDASERARRANELGADLFVSLHLNSNEEATAEGASTYHFGSSRLGAALADAIQSRLVGLGSKDCRVHARSYSILKETSMPAILVEPAFITNPDEEKRLDDPGHRASIAQAVVDGIIAFAANDPVEDL